MYYVIFRWATGGIKFWESAISSITPPFSLAHLTQSTLGRSSVRTQLLKIFSSETTWPLETKLWWNGPWVIPFQNCVRQSRSPTNIVAVTKNKKGGWNSKNLHLWNHWANWNSSLLSPLMTPFQNCVQQSRHPTNMATVAKNRKGGWNFNCFPLKLLGQSWIQALLK